MQASNQPPATHQPPTTPTNQATNQKRVDTLFIFFCFPPFFWFPGDFSKLEVTLSKTPTPGGFSARWAVPSGNCPRCTTRTRTRPPEAEHERRRPKRWRRCCQTILKHLLENTVSWSLHDPKILGTMISVKGHGDPRYSFFLLLIFPCWPWASISFTLGLGDSSQRRPEEACYARCSLKKGRYSVKDFGWLRCTSLRVVKFPMHTSGPNKMENPEGLKGPPKGPKTIETLRVR